MSMPRSTAPASASEAMEMVRAGLGYLASADATAMAAGTQAQCLRMLEQAHAVYTAARTSVLAAFTAAQGYSADADYSPRAWPINRTRITKGTAVGYTAWVRRAAAHPEVAAVLASGEMSESFARTICAWTDKLPEGCRPDADEILLAAAKTGMDLPDLAGLAGVIYARSRSGEPGNDEDAAFEDRAVRLETTFGGAGVLHGDLAPECAAVVGAVLDALSAPAGAEDTRSQAQRFHDGLQEAMRRLVAAGLLPERAGQPVKAWVHISLADLMVLDGSSALLEEWTARVRAQWAGTGRRPRRVAVTAARGWTATPPRPSRVMRRWPRSSPARSTRLPWRTWSGCAWNWTGSAATPAPARAAARTAPARLALAAAAPPPAARAAARGHPRRTPPGRGRPSSARSSARLSTCCPGPGGLASFLRRLQLGARLSGPSPPLDIGYAETIPAGIRNAVTLRDKHCRWAGGCNQPASACEVHHVRHKKDGGKTSTRDCVLLCWFHHQVVIHRVGPARSS